MSSDSDDDDINSNSSGEGEGKDVQSQIEGLREALKVNPNDYTSRIALVKALRTAGNLADLRDERDDLANRFPLPEDAKCYNTTNYQAVVVSLSGALDIWRQWLGDEERLIFQQGEQPSSLDEVQSLVELYERALGDYLAPDLWLDFCSFVTRVHLAPHNVSGDQMQIDDEGGTNEALISEADVRGHFEQAVEALAYHIPASHRLWQSYRRFEEAIADLAAKSGNKQALQMQLDRIRKIYCRQLPKCAFNIDEVYEEYLAWEKKMGAGEEFEPPFKAKFEKALEQLADRADHEISVNIPEGTAVDPSQPDYSKLDHWRAYIKYEEDLVHTTKTKPMRTRCLYERALQRYCLTFDLWESYSFFMMSHYKSFDPKIDLDAVIEVQLRAVRNYPYSYSLWCQLIATMDRAGKTKEDINAIFDKALSAGLQSSHDFLQVYKAYSDHRVRRVSDWSDKDQCESLLKLFDSNLDYFHQYFPDEASDLEKYYTFVVERKMKDTKAAMTRWEALVNKYGKYSANWLEAVNFALRNNDPAKARNFFKRAQATHTDQPDLIWKAWQDFERLEGSPDELQLAFERCTKAQREQEAKYYTQQLAAVGGVPEGFAAVEGVAPRPAGAKAKKPKDKKPKDKSEKGRGRKRNIDQVDSSEDATPSSAPKRRKLEDQHNHGKDSAKPSKELRPREGKSFDPKTVHVSGLPGAFVNNTAVDIIESTLKALFQIYGEVKQVRTVRSFEGGLKPSVYVEFVDEEACQKALNSQTAPELVVPPAGASASAIPPNDAVSKHSLVVRAAFAQSPKPVDGTPLPPRDGSSRFRIPSQHNQSGQGVNPHPHPHTPRQPHSEQFTIYVSNLSYRTNEEGLEKFFSTGIDKCAPPVSIRLVKDHTTGKSRGFAYVQFGSEEEVTKAVKAKNGQILDGRAITAAPSKPPPGSFLPRTAGVTAGTNPAPSAAMPPPSTPVGTFAKPTLIPRAVQRKKVIAVPKPSASVESKAISTPNASTPAAPSDG